MLKTFTEEDGTAISINVIHINSISPRDSGSIIRMTNNDYFFVKESLKDITEQINLL